MDASAAVIEGKGPDLGPEHVLLSEASCGGMLQSELQSTRLRQGQEGVAWGCSSG